MNAIRKKHPNLYFKINSDSISVDIYFAMSLFALPNSHHLIWYRTEIVVDCNAKLHRKCYFENIVRIQIEHCRLEDWAERWLQSGRREDTKIILLFLYFSYFLWMWHIKNEWWNIKYMIKSHWLSVCVAEAGARQRLVAGCSLDTRAEGG